MSNLCGSCTACCKVFAIAEFNKPAGKWCTNCNIGKGCKIYEDRPAVCIDYQCLWLQSQFRKGEELAAELRPDRCSVVFSPTTNENVMAAILTSESARDAYKKPAVLHVIEAILSFGMKVVVMQKPAARIVLQLSSNGNRYVEMTEPDENGMQWSK